MYSMDRNDIFDSLIMIVSPNQTLAHILKEQCVLYGFRNIRPLAQWDDVLRTLVYDIPDMIVSDHLPTFENTSIQDILASRVTYYDALPMILYGQAYNPVSVIPQGLSLAAALCGREEQQRLVEIIHEELDKTFLDFDKLNSVQKTRHLNILLATTDILMSAGIKQVFAKEGYYVSVIHSGKDVMTYVQGILPHIVFVEYDVPHLNGVAVLRWIKDAYPDTIVILMGQHLSPDMVAECLKAGAYTYLEKPFDVDLLPELCRNAFKKIAKTLFEAGRDSVAFSEEKEQELEALRMLKESEENFRTLVNASGDIIFRITPQGVLNFASPAVEEQLGYTQEDLEEQRINVSKFVHGEDLLRVMASIRQVIRGSSIQGLECRLMHKDRVHFRWYSINCYPMYNKQKFVGVGGIARDIASIKDFEQATRKQNARLSALNAIARLVSQSLNLDEILEHVLDKVLEILRVQAGSVLLRDGETAQLRLKCYRTAVAPDDHVDGAMLDIYEAYEEFEESMFDASKPLVIQQIAQHPQFTHSRLAELGFQTLISVPLRSKEVVQGLMILLTQEQRAVDDDDLQLLVSIGNQVGMTVENITLYQGELKARQRLEELNKLKDDFVAIVSHDLRSPLTAILGASEILLNDEYMDTPLSEEQRELVENIQVMGNQQLHLVNDLLDVAKIESGKIELTPTLVDLEVVAQQCYHTMKVLADNKNIELRFIPQSGLPKIAIDVPKINQVINNLVSNAIKFTESGGKVTIRVEEDEGNALRLSVSDTGDGIAPESLRFLFNKFQQIQKHGTHGERGTGLGLSICKNLIELHQGKIWAESRVGFGSTFCFTLPTSEHVILIIDDSLFVIKSLEAMLHEHLEHVRVVSALNGDEGFRQIEAHKPVVIILDYMMPDMDGIAVYQELRKRYGVKVPPTIFLTASQDFDVRRQIFELGAADYLQKPVDVNDLLPRLSRFL